MLSVGWKSPRLTIINYAFVSFKLCLARRKPNERESLLMTDRPRPIRRLGFSKMKSLQNIVQRPRTSKSPEKDKNRLTNRLGLGLGPKPSHASIGSRPN